jgi:Flp pilus assembly protein TadD
MARAQIASGDAASGLATYRQGTEAMPDSVPLLDRYARALMANKEFGRARDVLRRELTLAPGNQTVQAQVVQAEYSASGFDAALAVARSFSSADAATGEILVAHVLGENGKFDEGIALLQKVMSEKPSAGAANMLGVLYFRAGQKDQAVDTLRKWLTMHPDDVRVRLTLAQVYLDVHDERAALKEYEGLATARESDPTVLNNLAWLYQRKGDSRAQDMAERAYRVSPTPAVADTLGWILTSQGGAAAGLKYLENASKAMPDNLDVRYHVAVALQKTGKVDDARAILRTIVAKQVEFDSKADAKTLLAQLGG